jgi:hypothetical protein
MDQIMESLVSNHNFITITSYAKAVAKKVGRLTLNVPAMRVGAFIALQTGTLKTNFILLAEHTRLAHQEAEAIGLDLNGSRSHQRRRRSCLLIKY